MTNIAIHADSLSKSYKINATGSPALSRISELVTTVPVSLAKRFKSAIFASQTTDSSSPAFEPNGRLFWALQNVSFEIGQGEVVGVVGRNGAGKSTLLKILSRITEPSKGRFGVTGRVSSLLEVGTGFHPELTGRENIYVSGVILGMRRQEVKRRFDEIVEFSGVGSFLDTPVKHYSSGMQVRLGFAVAAHLESEILIIDEVLAVGDTQFQAKCIGKLTSVANSGRTILFVSHNMTAVNSICEKAIWLEAGQVAAMGPAREIVSSYEARSTAQCLENNWPTIASAPGSENVRLKRIALISESGSTGSFDRTMPLRLEMDYWVLTDHIRLNPSLVLQTADGVPVFNSVPAAPSIQEQEGINGNHGLLKGLYRSSCIIPPLLLNDDLYRVQLYMIRDRSQCEWRLDDLLCFQIQDNEPRDGWYGKWIGTVRPSLNWKFSQLNDLGTYESQAH